jgi:hypothetical protein
MILYIVGPGAATVALLKREQAMQRAIMVGVFITVVGAVYTGLSVDEYHSVAPVIAFSCAAVVIIVIALLRAFGRLGRSD